MKLGRVIPILRIFDVAKAKEFYLDFLGFQVDFEHRFEQDAPLYLGISHGECVIHLSEHYGDATPGSAVRIEIADVGAYNARLLAKRFKFSRPGVKLMPWGSRDMTIPDPFGNRLTFTSSGPT